MTTLDFTELHRELAGEFFHYADQRGRSYLDSLMLMYWRSRGPALVGCAANLPGSKFLVTTDDASAVPSLVRKGLMLCDHVVIRHASVLPISGLILDAMPDDFAGFGPVEWIEAHREQLAAHSRGLPHLQGPPPKEAITPFIDWLCSDGRAWFETGAVTYAPVLVPGDVDAALITQGVNLAPFFQAAQVLPQENRLISPSVAAGLANLQVPYLESITPELLSHFKEDEHDAVGRFQLHILKLLSSISADIESPEFPRVVEELALVLEDEVRELEGIIAKHVKTQSWKRVRAELLTLSALVFIYAGVPEAAIAGLTAAAVDLANSIRESLDENFAIERNPVLLLARLGEVSERSKGSRLQVNRARA